MKKSLALILFIFIFIFLLSPRVVLATVLFQDDFDDGNAEGWTVISGGEYWRPNDGMYGAIVDPPDTRADMVAGSSEWTDYVYEVDILGIKGASRNLLFRYQDADHRYGFHITYGSKLILEKVYPLTHPAGVASAPITFLNNIKYRMKVVLKGNIIEIYQNNNLILKYIDKENPITTGMIGLRVGTGAVYPTEVWYDNVLVTSLEPEPTPTPTPTPTLQPLILLPGLGASWNHEEIFLEIDRPQSAWYKTPFRNDYDGLIQTLQNAGYILGENLFVFYYDWLQPIAQSATDLKNYIDIAVNPPSGTKVELIGHSLGGLVGRTYIQNNPGSHGVSKLITAGSPHKGAPQVYKVWEGADLHSLLGNKERIGAGILLRLQGFGYPDLVQAIQNLVPSLSNLLFIDNYLKWDKDGVVKLESSMSQQNTWLKSLVASSELLDITDTIVGAAGDTSRWLRIVERNQIDEKLGRWEDGKPVSEEFAIGDGTVLEESAKLVGANIVTLAGLDHGDLVKSATGQEKILELLGFSGIEIVEQPQIPFEPALVFTVASPATLRVTDPLTRQIGAGVDSSEIPNATFSAQEKIIIIPEAIDGEYKAEIIGENGGGSYQLLVGQLTQEQDIWSVYRDVVGSGETDTYTIPIDNTLATTDSYFANLINSKLKNLLRQIRQQELGPRVKAMLSAKTLRILGQTKPLSVLLSLEKDQLAPKFLQRAILDTTTTIDYAEEFNPDSLPPLREILDLLGQLYQLLES